MSALSDIKYDAQPSVLYLIKLELLVLNDSKNDHLYPSYEYIYEKTLKVDVT